MIAVDTSVWIDFFRGVPSRPVELLVQGIKDDRILVPDLVLTEVLQGCDTDREFAEVQEALRWHRIARTVDEHSATVAARHYRTLRSRGITVRKTIDTLIATRCIVDGIPLLFSDRDFLPFVEHLGLRSALDLPGTVQ